MASRFHKRDYFSQSTDSGYRIGNELLLLDASHFWFEDEEPFIADATSAIFINHGSVDVSINMRDYHVKGPAMIIYMEGMVVRQGALAPNTRMDVIVISKHFMDNLLSDSNMYGTVRSQIMRDPVFPMPGQRRVTVAFNYLLVNLVRMSDSPFRLEAARHMALTLFYGFALSNSERFATKPLSRSENITERFYNLLKQYYKKERNVAFYADKLCITSKYLSLSVRETTGKPALQMIDDFVIAESKALLRSTDMTIDQISETMGFPNQSLFGKYFKRVTGFSPSAYRHDGH